MKYFNRTSSPPMLFALLFGTMLLGLVSQSALAVPVGTPVGTTISNSATLGYSVSGFAQPNVVSAAATFVVDEKINLTVGGGITTGVPANSTAQATAFTVTNNSNSPLDFSLAVTSAIAGDNFDPSACVAYVDANANGTYEAGTDTATYVDELLSGDTATVFAVCTIPAGSNTDTGLVGLTATARGSFNAAGYIPTAASLNATTPVETTASGTTVGIVLADVAGTEAGDGSRDAKHSGRNTYQIFTAALTVTKSAVLLCDPFNGVASMKNIPGAMTQWTVTISNGAGGSAATLTTITDALSATLAMDPGQVGGLTAPTNAATCVPGPGPLGFEVTVPVARVLGGSAAGTATSSYFTTTATADGVDFASPNITATFATILPVDGATGHPTAGLLNAGESVTLIFNTIVQ
jgi:hypothetical protein